MFNPLHHSANQQFHLKIKGRHQMPTTKLARFAADE